MSDGVNMPLFMPDSSWAPPKKYPNLKGVKTLGIDLETKDPLLQERGPGSFRNDGKLVGISVSTSDRSWYFPMRHLMGGNMDVDNTLTWFRDVCKEERQWVGANLQYEMEWLAHDKIEMRGKFADVQVIQALIDEEQESNALEVLCNQYLGQGKDETLLKEAANNLGVDPKSGLWKMHSKYVGPYAEFDSRAPLEILKKQWPIVQAEKLEEIFTLEAKVTPLLWKMRQQGVRVDLERAARVSKDLLVSEDQQRMHIKEVYGSDLDEWSGDQIARVCDRLKLHYPKTPKGNPSFVGDWLDHQDHDFFKSLSSLRELNRLRSTFVEDWIFKNEIKGVIHPQWKQLVADDGGTRTGRLAASNPNPQQVPSRSDLAPLIRALFIPMRKGQRWCKLDYSQQEPRLLVHFAMLCKFASAESIVRAYRDDPMMDFYKFLVEACNITRKQSKDLTLGRFYGMGPDKMATKMSVARDQAVTLLHEFDRSVPFVKQTADLCMNLAQSRGYIKTLLGRRRHFNWWEPADRKFDKRYTDNPEYVVPRRRAEAEAAWPGRPLRRSHCHKALNSLIQGSAADMTKACMVMQYEETGNIPYLQVHDETDSGVDDEQEAGRLQSIAQNCVKLVIPVRADMHLGDHWK